MYRDGVGQVTAEIAELVDGLEYSIVTSSDSSDTDRQTDRRSVCYMMIDLQRFDAIGWVTGR